jgi:acyl dehydratase
MTGFDPATHRMVPQQRWFEDFALGERFVIPSRTMTSAVFAAFQTASGDTHPVHYDAEYCRARGMPNLLAHGFQTLIHTAPGAGLFPFMVEESLVGFLEQSSRFLKPVFADDTIYPALEVAELTPRRTTAVWLACARPCSTSAANWCWRDCRSSSFAGGPPSRNRRSRGHQKRALHDADWLTARLARQSAPNAEKAREYWPFAIFSAGKGCRFDRPALPIRHEIP